MLKTLLFFIPCSLLAFEVGPWFSPLAEFHLSSSYSYQYTPAKPHAFVDHLFDLNIGATFLPNWDGQVEVRFSKLQANPFGMRLLGAQVRHLFLNDVAGDSVSLSVGGQFLYVPPHGINDPSFPYFAPYNIEAGLSLGKEIAKIYDWNHRFYTFLGLGIDSRGHPRLRPLLSSQFKYKHHHQFELFSEGDFIFNRKNRLPLCKESRFKIDNQSIAIGGEYRYLFRIWGSFSIRYVHRLFQRYDATLTIEYRFPFSIF